MCGLGNGSKEYNDTLLATVDCKNITESPSSYEIEIENKNSLVKGVIANGDNKLAIDCTPAINVCAFP